MSELCRDCQEGKHGACIGVALTETPDGDIVETDCSCPDPTHEE